MIDAEWYRQKCLAIAERDAANIEKLLAFKEGTITFKRLRPTEAQLREAWAEWWKEFFRLRDKYRRV